MTFKILNRHSGQTNIVKIKFLDKVLLEAGDVVNGVELIQTGTYILCYPVPGGDMALRLI